MGLIKVLQYLLAHPLNQGAKGAAFFRFAKWQLRSRLSSGDLIHRWINGAKIYARSGEAGVTGNIYCGLHEFPDMAFLLHALTADDCFIDIGANVGSYTVLASASVGARTICFEPVPSTYQRLKANIRLNTIDERVEAHNVGLGDENGLIQFSADQNCMNHVVADDEVVAENLEVRIARLDDIISESPFMIKIDVEGYELSVLRGASKTLKRSSLSAVILELNSSGLRYGFSDQSIVELMLDAGFKSYEYKPFERQLVELSGKNVSNGNTLFLRNIELIEQRLQSADKLSIYGVQL